MCPFHICPRAEHSIQPKPLSGSTAPDIRQTNGNLTYDCALSSPHFLRWNIFATSRTRQHSKTTTWTIFSVAVNHHMCGMMIIIRSYDYVCDIKERMFRIFYDWMSTFRPTILHWECASLEHLERQWTYWTWSWSAKNNELDEGRKYLFWFSLIADGSC